MKIRLRRRYSHIQHYCVAECDFLRVPRKSRGFIHEGQYIQCKFIEDILNLFQTETMRENHAGVRILYSVRDKSRFSPKQVCGANNEINNS